MAGLAGGLSITVRSITLVLLLGVILLPQRRTGPPNILFILSDDHAWQAISAYGSNRNRTPSIDRLARQGMRFDRCCVTNSICAPSRAVILTGRHSHMNGVIDNAARFDARQPTFPRLLQAAGYTTAMIGKWHLKSDPVGFDHWEILPGQGAYYNPDFRTAEGRHREQGYCTDIVTDKAIDWLAKGRDGKRPFLLLAWHKAPHRNWQPAPRHLDLFDGQTIPEPPTLFDDYGGRATPAAQQEMTVARHLKPAYDLLVWPPAADDAQDQRWWKGTWRRLTAGQKRVWERALGDENRTFLAGPPRGRALVRWKYQRYVKNYLRCVTALDEGVGRLVQALEDQGLARNTVVIYSSDQGWYLGEHGWYDKRWMYEESLRTPLIVRWPGQVAPCTSNRDLVSNLDLAQTILDIAGVPAPQTMQGASLVPLLHGKHPKDWRKSVYYRYYEYPRPHRVAAHTGVRTERHKLIHFYDKKEWELFDLERDPYELRSVYDDPAYGDVRSKLTAELGRLRTLYGDDS